MIGPVCLVVNKVFASHTNTYMRLGFKAKVALDALFTFRVLFTYVVIVGCIVFLGRCSILHSAVLSMHVYLG